MGITGNAIAADEISRSIKALAGSRRCCFLSPEPGRFLPGTHSQVDLYEMATTSDEAVGLLEAEEAGALGRRGVGGPRGFGMVY